MWRKPFFMASIIMAIVIMSFPMIASAQGIPLVNVNGTSKGTQYSLTLQLLGLMTSLTLLPSFLLMMTAIPLNTAIKERSQKAYSVSILFRLI